MMKPAAVAVAAAVISTLAACSHRVYSPPTQSFALAPATTMPQGQQAVDLEVAQHAQIFDPPVNTLGGRYHVGVGSSTELSVEGTTMVVDSNEASKRNRTVNSGRLGVRTSPAGGVALFGGAGGGYAPAGGGFAAVDAGITFAMENCTLVPVFQASAFVSQPLDSRPVYVGQSSNDMPLHDTPLQTVGGVLRGGLRLSLSPSACRRGEQAPWLYAGLGTTSMMDNDSHDSLMGAGLGLQVPL